MRFFFNRAIKILLGVNAAVLFAGAMLSPIYAIYVEKVGGDLLDASIAVGIFAFITGVVSLISGYYTDKVKQNELIIALGFMILGIGYFFYLLVDSVWSLFYVQVVIGIGQAISSPSYDAVYSKHLDGNKSGRQWAAWESMAYITTAAGAIIGGIIATKFGFNSVFVIMSSLSLLSALYIYVLPRRVL
jgi:sugar phosphate permease